MRNLLIGLLFLVGCDGSGKGADTGGSGADIDIDNDGYTADQDCNDEDVTINPGAEELCDGVDNDCDGQSDEGGATGEDTFYADNDNDGYGDAANTTTGCVAPANYVADATDCDDANVGAYPGAAEVCDGVDNDCDTAIDDDDGDITGQSTFYVDADADGFGDPSSSTLACDLPDGYAAEPVDCDDSNAAAYPGAAESCDGADNNCDGDVDEGLTTTLYMDMDGDGYGDPAMSDAACAESEGWVLDNTDCNDGDAAINVMGSEVCDDTDNDCDGLIDDADDSVSGQSAWYLDADADGYGELGTSVMACAQPEGYTDNNTDCNDGVADISPANVETCDGLDNDCDGLTDDSDDSVSGQSTFYVDADADGYGDPANSAEACAASEGWVSDNTDCDDTNAAINSMGGEVCDGVDNDCDGVVDDADDSVLDAGVYYRDADGDNAGDPADSLTVCTQPDGYITDNSDCNDSDAAINPMASEVCDAADNDCDGLIDDADDSVSGQSTWYIDADADGYGDADGVALSCAQPDGYVDNTDDPFEDAASASFLNDAAITEATDVAATADTLYVVGFNASNDPAIFAVNRSDGTWSEVYAGDPLVQPTGLTISADGATLYVSDLGAANSEPWLLGAIFSLPVSGESITTLDTDGAIDLPGDVAISGDQLYVSGLDAFGDGALFQLDLSTSAVTTISSGSPLVDPLAVAVSPDGWLYVVDSLAYYGMGSILMYDPLDGSYDGEYATGLDVNFPGGLAIDSADRVFWTSGDALWGADAIGTWSLSGSGVAAPTGVAVLDETVFFAAEGAADVYQVTY